MFENFENGKEQRRPESEPFIQAGLEKMRKMEEQYGAENLVYGDVEWGNHARQDGRTSLGHGFRLGWRVRYINGQEVEEI